MTGLAGFAWFFYITITGEKVTFNNDTIQFQIPLLIGVVIMKYFLLVFNGFKTHRKVFKANILAYVLYVLVVFIIDYKDSFF